MYSDVLIIFLLPYAAIFLFELKIEELFFFFFLLAWVDKTIFIQTSEVGILYILDV